MVDRWDKSRPIRGQRKGLVVAGGSFRGIILREGREPGTAGENAKVSSFHFDCTRSEID